MPINDSTAELRNARLSPPEMRVAIRKIDRCVKKLVDKIQSDVPLIDASNPVVVSMRNIIRELLINIFGHDSVQFHNYQEILQFDKVVLTGGFTDNQSKTESEIRLKIMTAIIVLNTIKQGFEEDLEDAADSAATQPIRAYEGLSLHPEIERQVSKLYLDGHYAEAVEKSVKVLNALVRLRSTEEQDGTQLMEKVFSPKNPILKFNDLGDQSEKDEQKGFMSLYAGAVMGLRNPRAHRIVTDDPERALEFIAFVSLLAKMLDDANLVVGHHAAEKQRG